MITDHYYSFSSPVSDTCYNEGDLQGSRDHCSADPFTDAVTSFVNDNNDIINRLCSLDDSVTPLPLQPGITDHTHLVINNYQQLSCTELHLQ